MVIGFLGVIICAKLAKANPALQPLAMLCALVMLTGLGVYGYDYMGGDTSKGMEIGMIYQRSIGDAAGRYLQKVAPGKKVAYVVAPGAAAGKLTQEVVKAFNAAYGADAEVIEIDVPLQDGEELESVMTKAHVDNLVKNSDAEAFVFDIGLPHQVPGCISSNKGKKVFFLTTGGNYDNSLLKRQIKNGNITAVVTGKSGKRDKDFTPDEDELEAAFNNLYVIADKDNLTELD